MDLSDEEIRVTMEEDEEYSLKNLQKCSYRFLQQTAKALNLPSNVKLLIKRNSIHTYPHYVASIMFKGTIGKITDDDFQLNKYLQKVYLVELIHTKKYRTSNEVDLLVKKVRLERNQIAMVRKKAKRRKKHVQSTEISSTSNSTSPPITSTPKRQVQPNSPELHSPLKYPQTASSRLQPTNGSDRVLRSFNRVKKPSYLFNNSLFGFIKTGEARTETRVNIVSKEQKYRKIDRICVARSVANWKAGQESLPMHRSVVCQTSPRPKIRAQRRISGIYPLNNDLPNVTIRRADGTRTKLNAIIQKPTQHNNNYIRQAEIINEIRNSPLLSIEPRLITEENYQNTRPTTEQTNFYTSPELNANKESDEYSEYYHKKIRAEQVRSRRESARCLDSECTLPRITEVFSKFNSMCYRDLTQPIYVQVNEPEIPSIPFYVSDPCSQHGPIVLEKYYNMKNILLTSQPLVRSTMTKTNTVFSTPLIVTSAVQPSPPARNNYDVSSTEGSQHYTDQDQEIPRVQDFLRNFRCDEETMHDSSTVDFRCSSEETMNYQELGAITLPEKQMVEDALELISQDGDYMERIGMDEKMQCILCDWAGPKFIVEFHIRKEHASDILLCSRPEVSVTYSLGRLAGSRRWLARLLDHGGALYVLLAKYEDPDCFMAALATLSELENIKSGSMTIYNKVTGEPYIWEGEIPELPTSMAYDLDLDCFKLELSRMDLLPNSANLKLLNRELVIDSPNKVVVGQPELDNIHISVIVNIF